MTGNRLRVGLLLSLWALLAMGRAARPSADSAALVPNPALAGEPAAAFASIDEAAVAGSSIYSSRPAVLRFSVTADDAAIFIVHPASGDARVDRANEVLNESKKRLLSSFSGRARPVYLLTSRMDVVRHASDQPSHRLARLRFQKIDVPKIVYTADRE